MHPNAITLMIVLRFVEFDVLFAPVCISQSHSFMYLLTFEVHTNSMKTAAGKFYYSHFSRGMVTEHKRRDHGSVAT